MNLFSRLREAYATLQKTRQPATHADESAGHEGHGNGAGKGQPHAPEDPGNRSGSALRDRNHPSGVLPLHEPDPDDKSVYRSGNDPIRIR